MRIPATGLCLLLLVPAIALADAVRLRSGDVLEGRVSDLGDRLSVDTAGGALSVRWRDVDAVLPGRGAADVFAERRRAVDAKDANALYALGRWAVRNGLAAEAKACFGDALIADPAHAAAQESLARQKSGGEWLEGAKLLETKGFVARDGAWVLREEAEMLDRRAAARRELSQGEKKIEDLLRQAGAGPVSARKFAAEALAKEDAADLVRPALRALRGGEPGARIVAAGVLARVKDEPEILRPLIRSAVMDRSADVRLAAAGALRDIGNADVVKPIARAMWSGLPELRANAAEALGEIGGGGAVEWLVTRVISSGGPGGRNHIFVGTQLTYVSDFDVEIAQAAQIGDPIVQTIREGAMLDCRVIAVREEYNQIERRVAFVQLRKATGRSIGDDAAAWKKWWDDEGRAALGGTTAAK